MTDRDRLQGVWRLDAIKANTPAWASWTHLVFDGDELRLTRADEVLYADEPTCRTLFRLRTDTDPPRLLERTEWMDPDGRVVDSEPGETTYAVKATYALGDDRLVLRYVDEDKSHAYVRETDPAIVARLATPPIPQERPTLDHLLIGRLQWDQNFGWWHGEWDFGSDRSARLYVNAPTKPEPALLDDIALALGGLSERLNHLKRFAASQLLDLWNSQWRNPDEPVLTDDDFLSILETESVEVHEDGSLELDFNDGGLFGNHVIQVSIDADGNPTDADLYG